MAPAAQHPRVRRFAIAVTIVLILVCNGLFFIGLWISGVDLEAALNAPEFYDPRTGYCVRTGWANVVGRDRPMQVCVEWLELDDPSGNTHRMQQGRALAVTAHGQWYYEGQQTEDWKLLLLLIFIVAVLAAGAFTKHYLVTRYRLRVQASESQSS